MRTTQLEYLVALSKHLSISKASEKLNVAPHTFNTSIKSLEEELGITLINRSHKTLHFTTAGSELAQLATEILEKLDRLQITLADSKPQQKVEPIRIAASPGMFHYMLPKILSKFYSLYPHIPLDIMEQSSQEVLNNIREDKVDIGLFNYHPSLALFSPPDFPYISFAEHELLACVHKDNPLAKLSKIPVKTFVQYPLSVYRLGEMKDNLLYQMLSQYGKPNMIYTSSSQFCRQLVTLNQTCSFTMKINGQDSTHAPNSEDWCYIPFKEDIRFYGAYCINAQSLRQDKIELFVKLLNKYV